MISNKLKNAIKLSDKRAYRIAHEAGVDPNTLSKIICGIIKVKFGDPRVHAVGRVLGISTDECFEMEQTEKYYKKYDKEKCKAGRK